MATLSEIKDNVKSKVSFRELFTEFFPEHYRDNGNSSCPFHDDEQESFQVEDDHGYCHAGCRPENGAQSFDVIALWMKHREVSFKVAIKEMAERTGITQRPTKQRKGEWECVYDYTDLEGHVVHQTVRFKNPKSFRQRRPDPDHPDEWIWNLKGIKPVLFRLPNLVSAGEVWIVEGEKDVLSVEALGFAATTSPMGAGKWHLVCTDRIPPEVLKGKTCYVIPDNHKEGWKHTREVASSLIGHASIVKILDLTQLWPDLPEKGDVSDLIDFLTSLKVPFSPFHIKHKLLNFAASSPSYEPEPAESPSGAIFSLTDLGNTQRLAKNYGDRIRFCKTLGSLVYDGKRWRLDDLAQVQWFAKETVRDMYAEVHRTADDDHRKALAGWAFKCESASRIENMIKLLPSEPGISVTFEVFDTQSMLLNCENGTLDLRTGNLQPHSPDDLITKLAPITYDPGAECPRWTQFLSEIMDGDDELVNFLQRLLGYSLTGEVKEQTWTLFWGKGANGKSTLFEAIAHVMGDYAINTQPETFMEVSGDKIRNDLARLRGARFITASELPHKKLNDEALKAFTGEGRVSARFLRREGFDFIPDGKLFFSANHRPVIRDTSDAFWRRVLLVPFVRQFDGELRDTNLRKTFKNEAPGILNWLLSGCLAWQEGGLAPPPAVSLAVSNYRTATDLLADFLENCCEIYPGLSVSKSALRAAYKEFCEKRGKNTPMSPQKFNEDLLGRNGITETLKGRERSRAWVGIGMRYTVTELRSCDTCNFEGKPCPCGESHQRDATSCKYYQGVGSWEQAEM